MKKRLFSLSILLLLLSGCSAITLSPASKAEMEKYGITKLDVCKDAGKAEYYKNTGYFCDPFNSITDEDVKASISKKKLAAKEEEDRAAKKRYNAEKRYNEKIKAKRDAKIKAEKMRENRIKKLGVTEKEIYAVLEEDRALHPLNFYDENTPLTNNEIDYYIEIKAREYKKAKAKARASKIAKVNAANEAKKVNARIKKLGVSEKEIRKVLKENEGDVGAYFSALGVDTNKRPLRNKDIDNYLETKAQLKKDAAYERKAKIKTGKQYVCTDGYDSWILKYNGKRITFGGVGMFRNIIGAYQQNKYDKDQLVINRLKGTVTYQGNKLTCKKR